MDKRVKITVQRFESLGGGRFKVKIAEKRMNMTNLVHEGEYFVTQKKMGRGRYVMKKEPMPENLTRPAISPGRPVKPPAPPVPEVFVRSPMEYQQFDEGPSTEDADLNAGEIKTLQEGG